MREEAIQYEDSGSAYWGEQRRGDGKLIAEGRGILITIDGRIYEGWFKNDRITGVGRDVSSNGEIYNGTYLEGRRHGPKGVLADSENGKYMGDFVQGRKHGNGVYIGGDGIKYEGEFENDKKHGKGLVTYTNGDTLSGDWQADKEQGTAIFKSSKGSEKRLYKNGTVVQRTVLFY